MDIPETLKVEWNLTTALNNKDFLVFPTPSFMSSQKFQGISYIHQNIQWNYWQHQFCVMPNQLTISLEEIEI